MAGAALVTVLKVISAVGSGLTGVRLYSTGLFSKYRVFFAYLIFHTIYVTCGWFLDSTSNAYFFFYVGMQPIIWFFYIAMVWELFGLVLARHKGFSTLGRWAMYVVSAVSVAVSAASMIHKITPAMPQSSVAVGLIVAIERGLDFSLAIFLILMLFVLSWYTVPLSRNVVVHAVIYTIFFLAGGMSMILRTLFGLKNLDAVDTGVMAATCACFLAWFFLLSAKGEETPVKQPWFAPEQEERILIHLDALNASLLKAAKK
ncbi:MAG: hypothetical protein ABSF25_13095 [Bryobacteraceae bacterium]|jgi:hypothetical protein